VEVVQADAQLVASGKVVQEMIVGLSRPVFDRMRHIHQIRPMGNYRRDSVSCGVVLVVEALLEKESLMFLNKRLV
jgi:hypothetical protein